MNYSVYQIVFNGSEKIHQFAIADFVKKSDAVEFAGMKNYVEKRKEDVMYLATEYRELEEILQAEAIIVT